MEPLKGTVKIEHNVVSKELAKFRACDPETRCFFCREWAQFIYRKHLTWKKNPTNDAPSLGRVFKAGRYQLATVSATDTRKVRATRMFERFRHKLDKEITTDGDAPSLTRQVIETCNGWITVPSSLVHLPDLFEPIEFTSTLLPDNLNDSENDKNDHHDHSNDAENDELDDDAGVGAARFLETLIIERQHILFPVDKSHLLKNLPSDLRLTPKEPDCDHMRPEWKSPSDLDVDRKIFNEKMERAIKSILKELEPALDQAWIHLTTFIKGLQNLETERAKLMGRGSQGLAEDFVKKQNVMAFKDDWAEHKFHKKSDLAALDAAFDAYFDDLVKKVQLFQTEFVTPRLAAIQALVCRMWDLVVPTIQQMAERMAKFEKQNESYLQNCRALAQSLQDLHPTADVQFAVETIQLETSVRVKEFTEEIDALKKGFREGKTTVTGRFDRLGNKNFKKQLKKVESTYSSIRRHFQNQVVTKIFPETLFCKFSLICVEALMQEGELQEAVTIEREVKRFKESHEDLIEERQFLFDDFAEGLVTGRNELSGILGRLYLKEGIRLQGETLAKKRQNALLKSLGVDTLDDDAEIGSKKKKTARKVTEPSSPSAQSSTTTATKIDATSKTTKKEPPATRATKQATYTPTHPASVPAKSDLNVAQAGTKKSAVQQLVADTKKKSPTKPAAAVPAPAPTPTHAVKETTSKTSTKAPTASPGKTTPQHPAPRPHTVEEEDSSIWDPPKQKKPSTAAVAAATAAAATATATATATAVTSAAKTAPQPPKAAVGASKTVSGALKKEIAAPKKVPAAVDEFDDGSMWDPPAKAKKPPVQKPTATGAPDHAGQGGSMWDPPAKTKKKSTPAPAPTPAISTKTQDADGWTTVTSGTNKEWAPSSPPPADSSPTKPEPTSVEASSSQGWGPLTSEFKETGWDATPAPAAPDTTDDNGWGPAPAKTTKATAWKGTASRDNWGPSNANATTSGWSNATSKEDQQASGWDSTQPEKTSENGWGEPPQQVSGWNDTPLESTGWDDPAKNANSTENNSKAQDWGVSAKKQTNDRWGSSQASKSEAPGGWGSESTSTNAKPGWNGNREPSRSVDRWNKDRSSRATEGWRNFAAEKEGSPQQPSQQPAWTNAVPMEEPASSVGSETPASDGEVVNFSLKDLLQPKDDLLQQTSLQQQAQQQQQQGTFPKSIQTNALQHSPMQQSPLQPSMSTLAPPGLPKDPVSMMTPSPPILLSSEQIAQMPAENLVRLVQGLQHDNARLTQAMMASQQEMSQMTSRYTELLSLSREREAQTMQLFEARKQTELEEARRYILSLESRINTLEQHLTAASQGNTNGATAGFGNQDLFAGYREEMRQNNPPHHHQSNTQRPYRGKNKGYWNKSVVVRCGNCGEQGHSSSECRELCRYCGGTGHLAERCPENQ